MSVIRSVRASDIPAEDLAAVGAAMDENTVVYVDSSGVPTKAQADAIATQGRGIIASAVSAADVTAGGDRAKRAIIVEGIMDGFTGLTIGGDVYLSDATAGAVTQTQPNTAGNIIQRIGWAISATKIYFNFGMNRPIALQASGNSDCNIV